MPEPRSILNPAGLSWGHLGVLVFFSLSGYLISKSWDLDPNLKRFWHKRALRILPGLAVATGATAWLLGPFVTDRSLTSYFGDLGTWVYPIAKTAIFSPGIDPPGLFLGNPAGEINASLWTIAVEVICYLCLAFMSMLRLRKTQILLPVVIGLAILGNQYLLDIYPFGNHPAEVLVSRILILMAAFFVGTLFWQERERVRLSPIVAAVVMVVAVASGFTVVGPTVAAFAIPYVVLTIGLAGRVVPLGGFRGWDLSYGTYLLAFPIQQAVYYFTQSSNPMVIFYTSIALVLPLAALSWRFVERPALGKKPLGPLQSL